MRASVGVILVAIAIGVGFVLAPRLLAPPAEQGDVGTGSPDQIEAAARFPEAGELRFSSPVAVHSCSPSDCFEPTIAIDSGSRMFITDAGGAFIATSTPLGTFIDRPMPPPQGVLAGGDGLVQRDASDRLWFSALARLSPGNATGVRLAQSTDQGLTWPTDRYIALPGRVDRQWILESSGPRVALSYNDLDAGIRVTVSEDGGASFGEPFLVARGAHIHGQGFVLGGRAIAFPYFEYSVAPRGLVLAKSVDGTTWSRHPIWTPSGGAGSFFPAMAVGSDEALHVAWLDGEASIRVGHSADGGETWRVDPPWSLTAEKAIVGPWITASQRGVSVCYMAEGGGEINTVVVRGGEAGLSRTTAIKTQPGSEFRSGRTDFAHCDELPDGRVAVTASTGATIVVASEAP